MRQEKAHRRIKPPIGGGAAFFLALILLVAIGWAVHEYDEQRRASRAQGEMAALDVMIGATVEPLDKATARSLGVEPPAGGLVVTSIAQDGPAERTGIRPGDVVERIGGKRVASLPDAAAALKAASGPAVLALNRRGHYVIVRLPIRTAGEDHLEPAKGDEP